MARSFDVLIVGGAVVGSSIACQLAMEPAFKGRIGVLERDMSYARAQTSLSVASIRQQFSTPLNIAISLAGIRFLREADRILAVDGVAPGVRVTEGGYLFLATPETRAILAENHRLQTALGADILWHEPDELARRFPWLATDGLAAGTWGRTGEGWLDGWTLMSAFAAKARSLGVEYVKGEAASLTARSGRVTGVVLPDGSRIEAGTIVLAAGTGSAPLAATAGVALPIRPRKRMVFTFTCRTPVPGCPLLIDPTGVYVRPEGAGFLCGSAPPPDHDGDPAADDFEPDHAFFEEVVWPVLADRIPAFAAVKPGRAWAGHYDMNLFDHNAVIGPVGEPAGLILATGFSGHGLQQSPAVGRAVAELVAHGRYVGLDLAGLGYDRIRDGRPLVERNVV